MLQRKVADCIKAAAHSGMPRFMGFMNDRQRELALAQLCRQSWAGYNFYGGFQGAERAMLCVFENLHAVADEDFPLINVFVLASGNAAHLTHRDYLGAILALGIKRECIGDILPAENGAQIYMQQTMLPFVQENLRQVGRLSVSVQTNQDIQNVKEDTSEPQATEFQTASVPSLRLDAVLAAMMKTGRASACKLIEAGRVQINHREVDAPAHSVYEGDVFSVRGIGKFHFHALSGKSRKNRLIINFRKY